jgi:hypothetical protein
VKDIFYEKFERVFDNFTRYHTKILLGDFNAKVGREDIFKPTIGNESLHEICNENRVRVVILVTPKNLTVKCTKFPHHELGAGSFMHKRIVSAVKRVEFVSDRM